MKKQHGKKPTDPITRADLEDLYEGFDEYHAKHPTPIKSEPAPIASTCEWWNPEDAIRRCRAGLIFTDIIAKARLKILWRYDGENPSELSRALCVDGGGNYFAVAKGKIKPVTLAESWKFKRACENWWHDISAEDSVLCARYEDQIQKVLTAAEAN